eukprot:1038317-Rhodomonas_salina.2
MHELSIDDDSARCDRSACTQPPTRPRVTPAPTPPTNSLALDQLRAQKEHAGAGPAGRGRGALPESSRWKKASPSPRRSPCSSSGSRSTPPRPRTRPRTATCSVSTGHAASGAQTAGRAHQELVDVAVGERHGRHRHPRAATRPSVVKSHAVDWLRELGEGPDSTAPPSQCHTAKLRAGASGSPGGEFRVVGEREQRVRVVRADNLPAVISEPRDHGTAHTYLCAIN